MWLVMMLAMMLPAAAPVTAVFMRMRGERSALGVGHAASFVVGYFVAWIAFGIFAAVFQRLLHSAGLFETHMLDLRAVLAGAILVGAGLYQLTPLKDVCLAHCRTPLGFLLGHWRDGRWGALRMGTEHGLYCLGCCWALMLLMFAGGVMSVIVMALISVFILLERLLPDGPWVTELPGLAMIAGGIYLIAGG
jgi:predicted metal-binding membrane protein